mgnify:CR=1 FL=1
MITVQRVAKEVIRKNSYDVTEAVSLSWVVQVLGIIVVLYSQVSGGSVFFFKQKTAYEM